jgi:hypothetical protein
MVQTSQSDPFTVWPERLAHLVAPDETDIATDLAVAYAAGGTQRQELFLRPDTDPGSSGAEPGPFLPYLWRALDEAYPVLRAVLSDTVVENVVAIAGRALSNRRTGQGGAQATTPAARWTDAAVSLLRDGLTFTGLPSADTEGKAVDIVEEMLTDPASAADFLDRLRVNS